VNDLITFALAAWTVTYGLTLSSLFERFRGWIGIGYDFDDQGNAIDRWGNNALAQLINCPTCTGFWACILVLILRILAGRVAVEFLAMVGILSLIGRWWTSQQEKWWL